MFDFLENSAFFGVVISVASYGLGLLLKKKFKLAILNLQSTADLHYYYHCISGVYRNQL